MGSAIGVNLNSIFFQMNKIYSDPISKVNSLVGGIEKNAEKLKSKGISTDVQKLQKAVQQMTEAAQNQEAAELALGEARSEAHLQLKTLKMLYEEAKMSIKTHFAMEQWATFGIPDKR